MRCSALACLPAALLSAFIGGLATPHTARAASAAFAVQGDEISFRRADASQFMDGTPAPRPATTSDSIRTGPGPDEPTTLVDGSDPDADKAVSTALNVAQCVITVAGAILLTVLVIRVMDLHSATPLDQGTSR
jgi:hypothetical protein